MPDTLGPPGIGEKQKQNKTNNNNKKLTQGFNHKFHNQKYVYRYFISIIVAADERKLQ